MDWDSAKRPWALESESHDHLSVFEWNWFSVLHQCKAKNLKILTSSIKRSEYGPDLIRPEHIGPERIVTENGHFSSAWFNFFPRDNFHHVHTLTVKFLKGLSLSRMFNELLHLRHTVFWPFLDCSRQIPDFEKECTQPDSNTGQINLDYKAKYHKPHISGP